MDLALAIELVKRFEGFRAKPYLCPAGIATIGYGSTHYADGRPVTLADAPISKEDAHALMETELRHRYLPAVLRFCPAIRGDVKTVNALTDFCYNLGTGRLQTSTLRRKVNSRDWTGAREQLRRWVRGGGRVLPGLVARREAEAALLPLGSE
jgi:lysozyme